MFNTALYSEGKIRLTLEVFAALLDRMLSADHPEDITLSTSKEMKFRPFGKSISLVL